MEVHELFEMLDGATEISPIKAMRAALTRFASEIAQGFRLRRARNWKRATLEQRLYNGSILTRVK